MKFLRVTAVVLLVLLVLGAGGITWVLTTPSGARWAVMRAASRIPASLSIGRVSGTLRGPLTLADVRYTAPGGTATVRIERLELEVELTRLFARTLHITRAHVDGAVVTLRESTDGTPTVPALPFPPVGLTLPDPPLTVVVAAFSAANSRVLRGPKELLVVDRASLAGRWTRAALMLDRFDLASPQGAVEFAGQLGGGRGAAVAGAGRFRWKVGEVFYGGELRSGDLEGEPQITVELREPFQMVLNATLPADGTGEWKATLDLPEFDPRGRLVPPDGVLAALGAQLEVAATRERAVASGEIRVNGETIGLETLVVAPAGSVWRIESLVARIKGGEGALRAQGTVPVAGARGAAELILQWDELAIPAAWAGRSLRTRGDLRVTGQADAYTIGGALALGPPGQLAELELSLAGNRESVRLERLQLNQPEGRLAAQGRVWLRPDLRWELSAEARDFNPGEFLPEWSGRLNGSVASTGSFADASPGIALRIDGLNGTLRDRPVGGRADLKLSPERSVAGQLLLESGSTRLEVSGVAGAQPEAKVSLAIGALADWLPKVFGGIAAEFTVRGEWPHLAIAGSARGDQLGFREMRAGSVELKADIRDLSAWKGTLGLKVGGVTAAGREISRLELQAAGEASAHEVSLAATADRLDARIGLAGGWADDRWNGTVAALHLAWADLVDLKLQGPAQLAAGRDRSFELGRACLADGAVRLCVEGGRPAGGGLHAGFSVHEVPLALVELIAPKAIPFALDGHLDAEGRLEQDSAGNWQGEARVASASAHATLPGSEARGAGSSERLLLYEGLTVDVALEGGSVRAQLSAGLIAGGRIEAEFNLGAGAGRSRPIDGRLEARLPNLDSIAALLPEIPGVAGAVAASGRVGGTIAAPEYTGRIEATGLRAELPRLGLKLADGSVRVEPGPDRSLNFTGGVTSGAGRIALTGAWTPDGKASLALKGDKFLAADLPSARVVIAPDLRLSRNAAGMKLTGEVLVSRAEVNLQRLPQGRARGHSRDVVVIDRETKKSGAGPLPLAAEVVVDLGRDARVTGYGLEARVGGRLTVVEAPGTPTTAAGEVILEGTYEGYGQNLKITRGRVLYAGTPLADPRLDITAMRDVEEIKAGIHLTGTAQRPEINVFANPAMGQADALAYLVTGKPVARVRSGAETALMDSAARSLGAAAGALVGERIGRRLGIDEVGIEQSDLIEGDVFTVGQYLSPRLYVAYGVGLFDAGDLVTLRYELSESIDLRAVRGPGETRAGIEYRIER